MRMSGAGKAWHPRRPLFWGLLLAAAGLAAWGFWPRPLAVEVVTLGRAPVQVTITEEARTRLRDRYLVSAPLPGTIARITLRPGDAVRAGEAVAVLSPGPAALLDSTSRAEAKAALDEASHLLEAATAEVEAADAERTRVRADAQRAEVLYAQRLVARSDVELGHARVISADAALRAAHARRDAAQARVEAARAVIDLQGTRGSPRQLALPSPIDGVVLRRLVESEGTVAAGQGLVEIGDPSAIEVVADLLTTDAMRIGPGTPVTLTRWGGEGTLGARVRRVEPGGFTKVSALGVEEQRVSVLADLDPAAAARAKLGDGFRLEAQFAILSEPNALAVPTAALFHDGPRWAVYVLQDGRARLRLLELGPMGEDVAAVRTGLNAGDRVVVYPGDAVREGLRIRARTP